MKGGIMGQVSLKVGERLKEIRKCSKSMDFP